MTRVQSNQSPSAGPGSGAATGSGGAADASQVADDNDVHYVPGDHKFELTVNGETTTLSPLAAVCFVLQKRYATLSDVTAQRTQEMQDQVNQINEASEWLKAVKEAEDGQSPETPGEPSDALQQWMDDNDIDVDNLGSDTDAAELESMENKFSSYVDQLSSTNDLKMLELKTVVNKSQEALTAADGVLQDIKQLMQTITGNMAR